LASTSTCLEFTSNLPARELNTIFEVVEVNVALLPVITLSVLVASIFTESASKSKTPDIAETSTLEDDETSEMLLVAVTKISLPAETATLDPVDPMITAPVTAVTPTSLEAVMEMLEEAEEVMLLLADITKLEDVERLMAPPETNLDAPIEATSTTSASTEYAPKASKTRSEERDLYVDFAAETTVIAEVASSVTLAASISKIPAEAVILTLEAVDLRLATSTDVILAFEDASTSTTLALTSNIPAAAVKTMLEVVAVKIVL
jgi:hypothetical protein